MGNTDTKDKKVYDSVIDELKEVYSTKLLPMEEEYKFHDFHSSKLRFVSVFFQNNQIFICHSSLKSNLVK